jgi:phosphoribosylamine---glycine ligase
MEQQNVLVIGSGGREHSIVKACIASPLVNKIIAAPGNGGIAREVVCKALDVTDINASVALAKEEAVDFVIVGPEIPLCLGIVDALNETGILAYGPNKKASQLEGSKAFAKKFLFQYSIPTAHAKIFTETKKAFSYLQTQSFPVVIKASGLAAGKGVIIAQNLIEAKAVVYEILEKNKFGESGHQLVIEEFLQGEEASIHIIACGEKYVALPPSQDHKRIGENDTGLNTGGMGAYAPASVVTPEINAQITEQIIKPTLAGLVREGIDFRGTLYFGIMITQDGPKVLEFNVRFGDPETQVLLPLLETDPVALMLDCARGELKPTQIRFKKNEFAMVVVMAAQGYPELYQKGDTICVSKSIPQNVQIIHAGTKLCEDGTIVTDGGRVLGVTAREKTLKLAAQKAYEVCEHIQWRNCYYRRDIGKKQLNRDAEKG